MLIVSWNVAGLKPALNRIRGDYGPSSVNAITSTGGSDTPKPASDTTKSTTTIASATNSKNFDPFAHYLTLHASPAILCLQEHKIPLTQLSSRSEPHTCSTIEGYESFWSCVTSKKSRRGFNGVVTYAKIGTVASADCCPLNDADLDEQGRCVMTDHGPFVVFNVYVPWSGGVKIRENLPRKMKFLNALQTAMERQRGAGKHVVLVGDLNAKIDRMDVYWGYLLVNVDGILGQMKHDEDGTADFPKWKRDVAKHWNAIVTVLQTIEAIPCKTTNPTTNKTFDRFRARVKIDKYIMLGSHEDTVEEALLCYTLDKDQSYVDPTTNLETVHRKKNLVSIDILAELMSKIVNVAWDKNTLREIVNSEEAGLNPDSPPYLWMKRLLGDDGMVDVFRTLYPDAEARFTCWSQFTNSRYSNEGGRIDFTIVDKALINHVEPLNDKPLRCGKELHPNPLGEEAALMAATAGGLFQAGSFAGGGIADATKRALDTQFGEAHSGMIYTPPSYSDHIAVSLLMKDSFTKFVGTLELDGNVSTRKAQPHKKQRSIASFFGSAAASSKSSSSSLSSRTTSTGGKKRTLSLQGSAAKRNSLHSSFDVPKAADSKVNGASSSSSKESSTKKKSIPKNSVLKHFSV